MLGSSGVEVGQVWGDQELILEIEEGDEATVMWRVQSSKGVCVETRSEVPGLPPSKCARRYRRSPDGELSRDRCVISHVNSACSATYSVHDSHVISA